MSGHLLSLKFQGPDLLRTADAYRPSMHMLSVKKGWTLTTGLLAYSGRRCLLSGLRRAEFAISGQFVLEMDPASKLLAISIYKLTMALTPGRGVPASILVSAGRMRAAVN